jgi:hypothetical protein
MRFRTKIKQTLRLYKSRSEGRINDAELLASMNRLFENIFLDGQVSQLREILKDGGSIPGGPIYNDTPGDGHFIGTIDASLKNEAARMTKGDEL